MKRKSNFIWFILLGIFTWVLSVVNPPTVQAVGEASTYFNIFVPPNNNFSERVSMLFVTAIERRSGVVTTVDIYDDDMDGDDDDTHLGIELSRGETFIVKIKDGAVNDALNGKADGDYFKIRSDHPVLVSIATSSDWQHDWVPAENKKMIGHNFYIYSPGTSYMDNDINVFAYEDSTDITVMDITKNAKPQKGITSVDFDKARNVIQTILHEGEDLIYVHKMGIDVLDPGHTYYVQSTKPVTVQYGALVGNARDGGGFVPSKNGFSSGELFYFHIPADYPMERELRIISFDDDNSVDLYGWNNGWQPESRWDLDAYAKTDKIGAPALCKLVCSPGKKIAVFEANWLETGASGTSDITSFLSSAHGFGAGRKFVCYMPPPGTQSASVDPFTGNYFPGRHSHLYIMGHADGTSVRVVDTKTGGDLISMEYTLNKDEYADASINLEQYYAIYNGDGDPDSGPDRPYLTVESSHLVAVMVSDWNDNWMTFATSVLLPNPETEIGSLKREYFVNEPFELTINTRNIGEGNLTSARTLLTLPDGMQYVSHENPPGLRDPDISNNGKPDRKTGETTLTWDYSFFNSGQELVFKVMVIFLPNYIRGKPVLNNTLMTPVTVSSGTYLDDYYESQAALPLKVINPEGTRILNFHAKMPKDELVLSWHVQFEHGNAGFNLYRSTNIDGDYKIINDELIPSLGDTDIPRDYSFVDPDIAMNTTYYYLLEDVSEAGESNFTGPISFTTPAAVPPNPPENLIALPGDSENHCILKWNAVQTPGIRGYNVYRSLTSPIRYTRINKSAISDTTFDDLNLVVNTDYLYTIKAIGSQGQESDGSNTVRVSGIHQLIPYEDLVSDEWNDWDLNDFILSAAALECYNSADQLANLGLYFGAMARGAMFDHSAYLYFMGAGSIAGSVTNYDTLGNRLTTKLLSGEDGLEIQIFASSHTALPSVGGVSHVNTRSDVPFVTGQTAVAKLRLNQPARNPRVADEILTRHINEHLYSLYDYRLYIKDRNKNIYHGSVRNPASEDIVSQKRFPDSPLIGYSLKLSQRVPSGWDWPLEYHPVWQAYPEFPLFISSGENENETWYLSPDSEKVYAPEFRQEPTSRFFSTRLSKPSGVAETGFNHLSGWPVYFEGPISATPAVADLDWDGKMEVIIGTYQMKTLVFDAYGNLISELLPAGQDSAESMASPAVADIDGDGKFEVIRGFDNGQLCVWDKSGKMLPGWPQTVAGTIKSTAAVTDLDNDEIQDIIVYAGNTALYVFQPDGKLKNGWPRGTSGQVDKGGHIVISASPAVGDVDQDGRQEIAIATNDGKVFLFHADGSQVKNWPQTTSSPIYASVVLADLTNDEKPEVIATTLNGNVFVWNAAGELLPNWPQQMYMGTYSSPAVGNLNADPAPEIVVGSSDGQVYAWDASGQLLDHWPKMTPSEIKSSPALADVNDDGRLDVIVGSNDGKLYGFNANATYLPNWPKSSPTSWIFASPVIADVDGDADLEVIGGSNDGGVYIWDEPGKSARHAIIWGQFRSTADHRATPQPDVTAATTNLVAVVPKVFQLYQNYPNPFNPTTQIRYQLAKAGKVEMTIYNNLGQKVRTLVSETQAAGMYVVEWDGRDQHQQPVASGVYFCKFSTATFQKKIKLLILK